MRQLIAQTDKDFQAAEVDQRRGVEDDAEYGVDGGKEPQKEKGEPSWVGVLSLLNFVLGVERFFTPPTRDFPYVSSIGMSKKNFNKKSKRARGYGPVVV